MRAILDTSVFIAKENARPLDEIDAIDAETAISAVTIAELHLGVLVSTDAGERAKRLKTLAEVESEFEALPIDQDVARTFAGLIAATRRRGDRRPTVLDALIAATALAHQAAVVTQDQDFELFPGLDVILV